MSSMVLSMVLGLVPVAAENVLEVERVTVAAGAQDVLLRILVDNDNPVMGLSFGAAYDAGLTLDRLTIEGTELGSAGLDAEYFETFQGTDAALGPFFGAAVIFDASAPFDWRKLLPGSDHVAFAAFFDVALEVAHRTTLAVRPCAALADADGESAVATVFIVAGEGSVPQLAEGSVTVRGSDANVVVMRESQEWYYLPGTAAPPENWAAPEFDPAAAGWSVGTTPIGYESGEDPVVLATVLGDVENVCLSVFLRTTIEIPEGCADWAASLGVRYDDGFVAYLDGQEIARRNVAGTPPAFDTAADPLHEVTNFTGFDETIAIEPVPGLFSAGVHVLSVQLHNGTLDSTDLSFAAELALSPFALVAVEPPFGPLEGGATVAIRGSGFSAASPPVVYFGDVRSPSAVVVDPGRIDAVVPPGAAFGVVDVEVADTRGFKVLAGAYRYLGPRQAGLHFNGGQAAGVAGIGALPDGAVFEGWFRRTGLSTRWTTLCALEGGAGVDAFRFDVRWNRVRIANTDLEDLTVDVSLGAAWHHFAASVSPAGRRILLDGIEIASDQQPVALPANAAFKLGGGFAGTTSFTGDVESLRVWNTIRPAAVLARERYATPEGLSELAGAWKLKDGYGDLARDDSLRNAPLSFGDGAGSDAADPLWVLFDDFTQAAITAVQPNAGPRAGGDMAAIYGTGFSPSAPPAVSFGGTPSPRVQVEAPWKLWAVVPAGDSYEAVDVSVTTLLGTVTATAAYAYQPDAIHAFVREGDLWDYSVPALPPDAAWHQREFDPASAGWARGPSGLGYGDEDDVTDVAWMEGTALTLYARTAWQLASAGTTIDYFKLRIRYDDGFVAYLNGEEVARRNVAGTPPAFDEAASAQHDIVGGSGTFDEEIDLSAVTHLLVPGTNVLAVEVHNAAIDSTDLSLSAELAYFAPGALFARGDVNGDGTLSISDAVGILRMLFSGRVLACTEAADANDDGALNVADAVKLLGFLFSAGAPLPPPALERPMADFDGNAIGCGV